MSGLRQEDLWDPSVESREHRTIQLQLFRLQAWLERHAQREILDGGLIRWFHRTTFGGVFPLAAGLVRGYACPFDMSFGPHRGAPYQTCEAELEQLSREFVEQIRALDELPADEVREHALAAACLHHARFIKIHPFLDGNGRTGRICANYFAARYGLRFVEVYRSGMSEYEAALAAYFRDGKISPLIEYWRPYMLA